VTLKVLHSEWASDAVSYYKFWYEFRRKTPIVPTVTMRLLHKAGEKTFFDFAEGIDIVDRRTGEVTTTQFFCGVMPFSSYTYGEFVLSQKQPEMLSAMERAWSYFGGVTPYVTVDNLKGGVTKAHLYDPEVNRGFCEFANHYGFAVIPARPYKPRDKGANESGIGVIQRSFFNEVRDRVFYSLEDLNKSFREYLLRLNLQVMKDHGVSRSERFTVESPLLKVLPLEPFERNDWKTAKVHADCHIQVEHRFYSVPHLYVGRTVRVRLTSRLIEVFSEEQEALAVHARLTGKERVSTVEAHYPEAKVSVARFEVKHAKNEAEKIGPETISLVNNLLDREYPLKYLRRVQGILRLYQSSRVSKEALEYACKQGQTFQKTYYEYIKATAVFYQCHGNRPKAVPPVRDPHSVYLHGSTIHHT
jgi:hypothetical protein